MTESEALAVMVAPGQHRPGKWGAGGFGGVIQIHVTRACNLCCYNCTQGSNLAGRPTFITPEQFEQACASLRNYPGVVGVFGGNPATHPDFDVLCDILTRYIPRPQRGLWCNHPLGHGAKMRATFNPAVSNLNVHLDRAAYDEFKRDWPESMPFGLDKDSRHSPCYVALKDVLKKKCEDCGGTGVDGPPGCPDCATCAGEGTVYDEVKAWELISGCDINRHWSAMIGVFRGQLRAWFCEIAGAQAMLHQDEPDYPDTGLNPRDAHYTGRIIDGYVSNEVDVWWKLPMVKFAHQAEKHCHECSVPLRGYGELAQADRRFSIENEPMSDPGDPACDLPAHEPRDQVSVTHQNIYRSKRKNRRVELVTVEEQLGPRLEKMTAYIQNSSK